MNGRCGSSSRCIWRSGRILKCGSTERGVRCRTSLALLVRDGQKDAIVHGNSASEKCGGVCARDGNVLRLAAQGRTGRPGGGTGSVTWLKRNPGRFGSAVRGAKTSIANEHLAEAAVGSLRLSRSLI